jgi:Co/Zn/Cd efflux system component
LRIIWWFNAMALLADRWHKGTHTLAIGTAALT